MSSPASWDCWRAGLGVPATKGRTHEIKQTVTPTFMSRTPHLTAACFSSLHFEILGGYRRK